MAYKVFVHSKADNVGVAVAELEPGETVQAVILEDDSVLTLPVRGLVPLGHKIALRPIPPGGRVIKYGEPIGEATSPIEIGDHVHVHNIRTLRWNYATTR